MDTRHSVLVTLGIIGVLVALFVLLVPGISLDAILASSLMLLINSVVMIFFGARG